MKNKNIIAVQNLIRRLDEKSLKNSEVVAYLVRAFGIVQWGPAVFGDDEKFKNSSLDMAGIYQTPDQIAKALVYLTDFKINHFLEVGTFQGGNFLFVSEYLRRFNPDIWCLTIDPTNYLNPEVQEIIDAEDWLTFTPVNSDAMSWKQFDLVFIDGDHTSEWMEKDWNNVGRRAKICMIHDIQETTCPDIVAFWENLKMIEGRKMVEFLDYSSAIPLQGIGMVHDRDLKP